MAFITVGIDTNKVYNRANPPGGKVSELFAASGTEENNNRQANYSSSISHSSYQGLGHGSQPTDRGPGGSDQARDSPVVSRFAGQFDQPQLISTTTQMLRTPNGLLKKGVPVESQEQEKHQRVPPGGRSSKLW